MSKLASYIIGFALSLALTAVPLALLWLHDASHHSYPSHEALYALFVIAALAQLGVQLYFLLHVGSKDSSSTPVMLGFALFVMVVVVGGTLWIMSNLAYLHEHAHTDVPFINGAITPQAEND
jgi:heme/copper-type cytochrome/quinol oxidase subunit 4